MSNKLEFMVRLSGKERKYYEKKKKELDNEIPNLSHNQAIGKLLNQLKLMETEVISSV